MTNRPDSDHINDDIFWSRVLKFSEEIGKTPPKKNFSGVQINWGHGRLAAYTSDVSFIAQFCALNDLKEPGLERFFADYFGCRSELLDVFNSNNLSLLADILDEPLSIVKTVASNNFYLPVCFGEFKTLFERKHEQPLSYCPACISKGYHASFHQAPWLYQCPIHGEPIKRILIDRNRGAYVKTLTKLLRGACSRWPNVWGAEIQSQDARRLGQLRDWLESVRILVEQLSNQNVASTGDMPYSFKDIDTLLGRLDAIAPIPAELLDLFIVPPIRQQQLKVEVNFDAASRIKLINKVFSLWSLLQFYNKYAIVVSRDLSSRLLAIREIERLQNEHGDCRCHWSWDRYLGWEKICPGEEYTTPIFCPYEYAIKELKDRWITFTSLDDTPQAVSKMETQFLYGCAMVLDNNLGYIPDPPIQLPNFRGLSQYLLLPKLTLENDVEFILETLLACQATAHFEQLAIWLSSITEEQIPIRATTPGKTNLFQSENAEWVSTWISLEEHSIGSLARWNEGRK